MAFISLAPKEIFFQIYYYPFRYSLLTPQILLKQMISLKSIDDHNQQYMIPVCAERYSTSNMQQLLRRESGTN